jgi:hypothetical protein
MPHLKRKSNLQFFHWMILSVDFTIDVGHLPPTSDALARMQPPEQESMPPILEGAGLLDEKKAGPYVA